MEVLSVSFILSAILFGVVDPAPFSQSEKLHIDYEELVTSSPAVMIIGTVNGTVSRCLKQTPSECEVIYRAAAAVKATAVHGEFLFVSLSSGALLRCSWEKTDSCKYFYEASSSINGLAIMGGFIYAGLENGTILQCQLDKPDRCWTFSKLEDTRITSLAMSHTHIYVGIREGKLYRCTMNEEVSCILLVTSYYSQAVGVGLSVLDGRMPIMVIQPGYLYKFDSIDLPTVTLPGGGYRSMAIFNRQMYTVQAPGNISICSYDNHNSCTSVVNHEGANSISFAYATHHMQSKYKNEEKSCNWQSSLICPPTIIYYPAQHRALFEVQVIDGKLYGYSGNVVDTRNADEGVTGKAAIFAMGPDGQILLSNLHKPGLFHISSLFAGSPVSGAGEMVVNNGTIESITACSDYYWPDVDLNRQVIVSLDQKGYKGQIDSRKCSYRYNKLGQVLRTL